MKKTLFLLCFILLPVWGFSQGEFLPEGQSGLGITAGMAFYEEAKGFAGGVGYSINGIFDIGLSYANSSGYTKGAASVSAFSPSVSFHVVKQDEKNPVNFSASLAYVSGSYSHENSSTSFHGKQIRSSKGYIVGGQVFTKTNESGALNVMFAVGVYLNLINFEGVEGSGYDNNRTELPFSDKENNVAFVLGLPFIIPLQKSNILVISPSYSVVEDNNSINIAVSLIIPSKRNNK